MVEGFRPHPGHLRLQLIQETRQRAAFGSVVVHVRPAATPPPRPRAGSRTPAFSFDHLVGTGEQRGWHFEAERLGSRQIDDEIELSRLLDWKVARLRAA